MARNIVQRALGGIGRFARDTKDGASSTFTPLLHNMETKQKAADEGEKFEDAQWRERMGQAVIPAQRKFNQELEESGVMNRRLSRAAHIKIMRDHDLNPDQAEKYMRENGL